MNGSYFVCFILNVYTQLLNFYVKIAESLTNVLNICLFYHHFMQDKKWESSDFVKSSGGNK